MFGTEPDQRACFHAQAHEAWNRLRAIVGDRNSILAECRRGEQSALQAYNRCLEKDNLPSVVRNLLVIQRNKISRSLNQIEAEIRGSLAHTSC